MKNMGQKAGKYGEEQAVHFLQKQGVRILQKNYRCRYGEIDLIAWDGQYYLIVEVKQRTSDGQGAPAEAVDYRKQKKICRTLNSYRMKQGLDDFVAIRFDVIEIDGRGQCHWIQNAFDFIE